MWQTTDINLKDSSVLSPQGTQYMAIWCVKMMVSFLSIVPLSHPDYPRNRERQEMLPAFCIIDMLSDWEAGMAQVES